MDRRVRLRSLFCITALLILSGCASPPHVAQPATTLMPRHYQPQLVMAGRLAAQYEGNTGQQSISLHFTWSQTADRILISLDTPTGQTAATIDISAAGATLNQPGKPPRVAADANDLTIEMLGWPLPVAGLRDWLQGFIDSTHNPALGEATTAQPLHADGWTLRYVNWVTDNNTERPKRLDLSRQTVQAGLVSMRIVVDTWDSP